MNVCHRLADDKPAPVDREEEDGNLIETDTKSILVRVLIQFVG